MKKDQKQSHDTGRREFLRGTAAVSVGAAVASAVPSAVAAPNEDTEKEVSEQKGYRLTKHIIEYYKTTAS